MNQLIPLSEARAMAEELMTLLAPACDRIEIAGSVRRLVPRVRDIELVAVPRLVTDMHRLIADAEISALDRLIEALANDTEPTAPLRFHARPANGTRYKRLWWRRRVKVDLFVVLPPACWGAIHAIRTGPAEYSQVLVTKRRRGGALPDDLAQHHGCLWRGGRRIETPEESEFFATLGVPFWAPCERSARRLRDHLREAAAGRSPNLGEE
jgi:DNA polymerase/3'-5' exonuclease PolX